MRCRFSYVDADLRKLVLQPDTSEHCKTTDTGYRLVYHTMCLFTSPAFAGYSLQPATEGGLRMSRSGCMVLRRGGLPVQRRSPIQALTGPSVVDPVQRVVSIDVMITFNCSPATLERGSLAARMRIGNRTTQLSNYAIFCDLQ